MSTPPTAQTAWYEVADQGDGIVLISEPHVHPLLRANMWLVRGRDRDVLIDCGLGVQPLLASVPGLFAEREPVVVLTHAHLDHMGAAHEFEQVWAHEAEPVGRPGRGSLHGPTLAELLGLDETLPDVLLDALPHESYDVSAYALRPATVTRTLEDGDLIDLGDRCLRVLHLPGHTPGSIVLVDEAARLLFSGDVVYDDELLDDLTDSDPVAYAASMRRLLDLDVTRVLPGHDQPFDGARLRQIVGGYLAGSERNADV